MAGATPLAITLLLASAGLQDFEFRGLQAGMTMDQSKAVVHRCGAFNTGPVVNCLFRDWTIAGIKTKGASAGYVDGRLATILVQFEISHVLTMRDALTARYGPSCEQRRDKWQNRLGAQFDNEHMTWCFKTGKLTLSRFGDRIDMSRLMYVDRSMTDSPPTPPTIDF